MDSKNTLHYQSETVVYKPNQIAKPIQFGWGGQHFGLVRFNRFGLPLDYFLKYLFHQPFHF